MSAIVPGSEADQAALRLKAARTEPVAYAWDVDDFFEIADAMATVRPKEGTVVYRLGVTVNGKRTGYLEIYDKAGTRLDFSGQREIEGAEGGGSAGNLSDPCPPKENCPPGIC